MSENFEQKQFIQWCRTRPELQFFYHIPNENTGGKGWGIRNRQLGVKRGVPDLCLPIPSNGFHGLYIEMKAPNGVLTMDQLHWLDALTGFGYKAVVAFGWQDAKRITEEYLNYEPDPEDS